MTDLGQPPEAAPAPEEPQPQQQQPSINPSEAVASYQSLQARNDYEKAVKNDNEEEVQFLSGFQARQAARASIRVLMDGGDPAFETRGLAAFIPPYLESMRRQTWIAERDRMTNEVVAGDDWAEYKQWWNQSIMDPYKAQNDPELGKIKPGMSDEELIAISQRLEPITMDPNEIAERRTQLMDFDARLREASGGMYNVFNHPKTRRIANFINRETAIGTPGYFRSGEQELPAFTQYVAQPVVAGMESVMDPMAKLVFGAAGMVGEGIRGLTGGTVNWLAPSNFIETEDGQILTNEGDIPGMLDMFVGIRAKLAGQDMARAMAGWEASKEYAWAQSNGFGQLLTGVSSVGGMLAGYAPTAAMGAQASNLMNKGLRYVGAMGKVTKGAPPTLRAQSIMQLTAPAGQAAAFALQEGISTGSHQQFLSGMQHGAMTGLVMSLLGSMGRGVERLARGKAPQRTWAPEMNRWVYPQTARGRAAQGLGLTAEAMGFTGLEAMEMEESIWEFVKTPNADTFGEYAMIFAKNWLGILLGKGLGAQFGDKPKEGELRRFTSAMIEGAGERLREFRKAGVEPPKEMTEQIAAMGTTPERLIELSMAAEKGRTGDVEAAAEASRLRREIETRQAGAARSPTEEAAREVEAVEREIERPLREPLPSETKDGLRAELGRLMKRMTEVQGEEFEAIQKRIQEISSELERPAPQEVFETGAELGSIKAERALVEAPELPGVKDVRREDIFARMQGFEGDPVRTPQRKGRIGPRGPNVKGFFNRIKDMIRFKGDSELAERAHEFAHSVQEAAVGLEGQALPARAMGEAQKMLEGMHVPKKAGPDWWFAETWAEFWARDLLGDNVAQKYPELAKTFEPMMAAREGVLTQFSETKGLMQRLRDIGEFRRARMQIEAPAIGDRPSLEMEKALRAEEGNLPTRMARKMSQLLFQDIETVQWASRKWAKIAGVDINKLPIHLNIVKALETYTGKADAVATSMITEGILRRRPDGEVRHGPSLQETLSWVKNREQREAFMVGLAEYKNWVYARGQTYFDPIAKEWVRREPRITHANAAVHARNVKMAAVQSGVSLKQFMRSMRKTKGFFDDLIRWTADEGLISREDAEKMIGEWSVYVPFQRYVEGAMRSGVGTGAGMRAIKRGGAEKIADPFEAMAQVTRGIVRQVHRHRATESLYQMSRKLKGMGGFVEEVAPDRLPQELKVNELIQQMERQVKLEGDKQQDFEFGLETMREALGDSAGITMLMFRQAFQPSGNKPIILHRTAEGKRVWLQVDKGAYEALQSIEGNRGAATGALTVLQSALSSKPIRMPTAVVRYFATGINMSFALRNMFRDAALFPGYSQVDRRMLPFAGMAYWVRGATRLLATGKPEGRIGRFAQKIARPFADKGMAQVAAHYRQVGGEAYSWHAQMIKRKKGAELMFGKEAQTPRNMIEYARDVIDKYLGNVIDIGERALRFDEFSEVYKKAVKEGKPEQMAAIEALHASQEVTVNFTRAGILGRELNKLIPYFNAGMQGQRKFFRSFLGMDGKRAMQMSWTNMASTMGTMTALQYIFHRDEDWFKDLAPWQRFYAWHFKLGDQPMQIPIPHLAGTAAVSIMDQLFSENKMDPMDIVGEWLEEAIWSHVAAPSFMLPFLEWTTNRSFWRERPIVPDWMLRSRIEPHQFDEYTKGYAKWLSSFFYEFGIKASPMKLENLINQTLGGMPNNLDRTISGLGNAMGFELNDQQDDALDQIPVLSSLFRHFDHKGSRAVNEFWEEKYELDQKVQSKVATPQETARRAWGDKIEERLRAIDRLYDAGYMSKEDAARQKYEVALPFVEQGR